MRCHFGQFEIKIRKTATLIHVICMSHDAHTESHDMAQYMWTEEETEIFSSIISD